MCREGRWCCKRIARWLHGRRDCHPLNSAVLDLRKLVRSISRLWDNGEDESLLIGTMEFV